MRDPVLHLIAGPNGSGKSTLYDLVIRPVTHLEFVNADVIAAQRWPDDIKARAYEAAELAAQRRTELLDARRSFVTETVFSHPSKVELVETAVSAGYLVTIHLVAVPEELAVARVASRIQNGGHGVPERKIRQRYRRLWPLVSSAIGIADTAIIYDNSRASSPFEVITRFEHGQGSGPTSWPTWTPAELKALAS